MIDSELQSDTTSFLKTLFLFFFELMGVDKSDTETLKVLFGRLLEKKSNVGGEKDLTKVQQESLKIDFD